MQVPWGQTKTGRREMRVRNISALVPVENKFHHAMNNWRRVSE
jgi:hypothetical protein